MTGKIGLMAQNYVQLDTEKASQISTQFRRAPEGSIGRCHPFALEKTPRPNSTPGIRNGLMGWSRIRARDWI